MRNKTFAKRALLVSLSVAVLTTGGVYATWNFAAGLSGETAQIDQIAMGEWETDLVLPGGMIADSHKLLIQDLLSDTIGLNNEVTRTFLGQPSNGSYLSKEIYKRKNNFSRDTIGSMAIKQGDTLASDFKLSERNLDFLIWFVSKTEYHIFTTSVDMDAVKNESKGWDAATGEYQDPDNTDYQDGKIVISPIYRTIIVYENDEWIEQTSSGGYAMSAYYQESQYWDIYRSELASIDPDSFVIGDPP